MSTLTLPVVASPVLPTLPGELTARTAIEEVLADLNPNTLKAYRTAALDFGEFMGLLTVGDVAEYFAATPHGTVNFHVLQYKNQLAVKRMAPASIANRINCLAGLVKRLRRLGIVNWELDVPKPKTETYRDTRGPGSDTIAEMIRKLENDASNPKKAAKARRDIAVLELLFNPALRRFEVCGLDLADVDFENSRASVRGKGKAEAHWITLPEPTLRAIRAWVEVRGDAPGPLFWSVDRVHYGHRLTGEAVRLLVERAGKLVGIDTHPHALRHSGITTALMATGGDIVATSEFARHSSMDTTKIYLDNLADSAGATARKLAAMTRTRWLKHD